MVNHLYDEKRNATACGEHEGPDAFLFSTHPESVSCPECVACIPTTTETMTTSHTGGSKSVKPQRYDLLPKAALDGIAEAMAYGTNSKYPAHNWRHGFEWSKSYSALMRHMTAHWEGETLDPESGLPHLAHAGCHIMFMLTWLKDQGEGSQFDDRFVKPE